MKKNDKNAMFIINNNNKIKGVINMNKFKKIGLTALAGSLVAVSALLVKCQCIWWCFSINVEWYW